MSFIHYSDKKLTTSKTHKYTLGTNEYIWGSRHTYGSVDDKETHKTRISNMTWRNMVQFFWICVLYQQIDYSIYPSLIILKPYHLIIYIYIYMRSVCASATTFTHDNVCVGNRALKTSQVLSCKGHHYRSTSAALEGLQLIWRYKVTIFAKYVP